MHRDFFLAPQRKQRRKVESLPPSTRREQSHGRVQKHASEASPAPSNGNNKQRRAAALRFREERFLVRAEAERSSADAGCLMGNIGTRSERRFVDRVERFAWCERRCFAQLTSGISGDCQSAEAEDS